MVEKPWAADDYMTDVINRFCRQKGSIAQLIQHSDVWGEEYNRNVKALEDDPFSDSTRLKRNLRACKHRIESIAEPLGRSVLHLHALIQTAIAIALRRKGRREGTEAVDFLEFLSEEACVKLAMVADAGLEGFRFKGFWDSEHSDPAEASEAIEHYRRVCSSLFVEGNVLKVGYTRHMLRLLKKPVLIPGWITGSSKTLGSENGADVRILHRCLQRMQCYVYGTLKVLSAEFPSWEILQNSAFSS